MSAPSGSSRMRQIGEVADAVGLSLRTIRYYEETGLVPPSGRSSGGFRLYTNADIERLRTVKHLKPLDLSIEEMLDLLTVRDRLADRSAPERDRDDLVERLAVFAELAGERCQRLRDRLEAGESISAALRDEVDAENRRSSRAQRANDVTGSL